MSHISRICSRMSSGKPLSGRFIAASGCERPAARSAAFVCSSRVMKIRFVVAGCRLLATEHEARLYRRLADLVGQYLVHADAAAQLGSFLKLRTGENIACLPRMDADAHGRSVEQAANNVELRLQRRER